MRDFWLLSRGPEYLYQCLIILKISVSHIKLGVLLLILLLFQTWILNNCEMELNAILQFLLTHVSKVTCYNKKTLHQ